MKNSKQEKEDIVWWKPSLDLFLKLSAWIAFPVVMATFLGRWLDERYDSEPWLFLSTVGFSFLISMFGLFKNATEEYNKINIDIKKDDNNKED